jgi:Flp pilus assembly protein protease CpaA
VLSLAVMLASYTDLKDGKIPNVLTGPMMVTGLLLNGVAGQWMFGINGLLTALAIHFTLFALTVQRAGDAKLFMGIGALVGASEVIDATAWFAVLYLPIGLLQLAIKGRLGNLAATAKWALQRARGLETTENRPEPTLLRTAPIIAAAALAAWITDALAIW